MTISATTDTPTLKELASRAPDLLRAEEASRGFWDTLTSDKRSVVLLLAKESLERLLMDLDRWVPDCVVPGGSDWIDLRIRFQLGYMEEAQIHQTIENIRDQEDAIAGVRQLIAELSD